MANQRARGKRIEDNIRKHYEAESWRAHQAISTGTSRGGLYISNTNDIYECIDILLKHPLHEETMWLQTTTKAGMSARIRKVKDSGIPWKSYDRVAVVGYYGKGEYKGNKESFYLFRWMHEDYAIIQDDEHRLYTSQLKGKKS